MAGSPPGPFGAGPVGRSDGGLAGLVVLHRDKDFDVIAEVTGQALEELDGVDQVQT